MYGQIMGQTSGSINLQATLSAGSSSSDPSPKPHHPITCSGDHLAFYEDGSLECGHTRTDEKDLRSQACLNASLAILLFELVNEKFR